MRSCRRLRPRDRERGKALAGAGAVGVRIVAEAQASSAGCAKGKAIAGAHQRQELNAAARAAESRSPEYAWSRHVGTATRSARKGAVRARLPLGRRSSSDECRPRSTRGARIHAIARDRFVGCALPPGAFVPMHTMRSANRVALLVVVPSRHVVAAGWTAPTTRLRKRAGPVLRGADTFSAP